MFNVIYVHAYISLNTYIESYIWIHSLQVENLFNEHFDVSEFDIFVWLNSLLNRFEDVGHYLGKFFWV